MQVGDDLQFVAECDRGLMLDGDPQRRLEQFGCGEEVFFDAAPVHRVVHVVEQVDVGDPHWVLVNMCRVLAGAALEVGLPPQPVDIGGAAQADEEVVADARRH